MKHFLPLVLLLAAAPLASAQDIFDNPDNAPYLGVRLSLDVSCPTDLHINGQDTYGFNNTKVDIFDPGAGFELGAVYNIPLYKNLYFEPGLLLFYATQRGSIEVVGFEDGMSQPFHYCTRRFGFRIPMRVGYHFDFDFGSLAAFTGPRFSLPLVGRYHTSDAEDTSTSNLYSRYSDIRRFDIGWQFGASYTFERWSFEISGTCGMIDMYKGPSSMHFNGVDFTVGYNF